MFDILDRDDCRQVWVGWFSRFAEPVARRSEPAEPARLEPLVDHESMSYVCARRAEGCHALNEKCGRRGTKLQSQSALTMMLPTPN
jgi:hypothetical protein